MTDRDKRIIKYLELFPHRDENMANYGVCRDWLRKVLDEEAAVSKDDDRT
jgi:hypothetical protein